MAEIKGMNLDSEDLVDGRLAQLKEMLPEAFTESGIDFDKLRLLLGDEVDEGQERYAFTWPGKADAIRQSQTPSAATLRPCVEKSRGRDGDDGSFDSDNIYIEGDNLEVLKLLQRGYHGKVKMIYIDPPYNTGNDFVYKDRFGDSVANYKEQTNQGIQSNADTSGRFHANWCSMLYPRLKLARELLADDGVLLMSIDDHEFVNMVKIANEIFGEGNHAATFLWQKTATPGSLSHKSRKTVEYVLAYEKRISNQRYYGSPLDNADNPLFKNSNMLKTIIFPADSVRFLFVEDGLLEAGSYENGILFDDIHISSGRNNNSFRFECHSTWKQETVNAEVESGTYFLVKTKKMAFRFQRPEVDGYKTPNNLIDCPEVLNSANSGIGTNESASSELSALGLSGIINYPKPTNLIEFLVEMICKNEKEAVVMDFFSGSATTAHAVANVNLRDGGCRRTILVQLPESLNMKTGFASLCDFGEERIRRAGDKMRTELEEANRQLKMGEEPKSLPDIGFRVFAFDDSCIEKPEPGQLLLDVVKPDRSDLDIVFEMMLKWGLELTLPVEEEDAAGYPIYSVAYGELVCCLADGLTMEALDAIADMEPRRVLMRDSILTDALKLNAIQAFKRVEKKTGREVELRTV